MKSSRREFLSAIAAVSLARSTGRAAPADAPLIDIHQHADYVGRGFEQMLAHQEALGATMTVLLAGAGWMESQLAGNAASLAARIAFACSRAPTPRLRTRPARCGRSCAREPWGSGS